LKLGDTRLRAHDVFGLAAGDVVIHAVIVAVLPKQADLLNELALSQPSSFLQNRAGDFQRSHRPDEPSGPPDASANPQP